MQTRGALFIGLALVVVGLVGLLLVGAGVLPRDRVPNTPAARGAWLFRTGTRPDGQAVPYAGGMMMRQSCAYCHGADGRGRRTAMFTSPDVTYRNLTDPAGMLEPDGARGATYTDALIGRAVTQGLDAEGASLTWPMPRWHLSDQEIDDLLAYLRTLP